MPVAGYDLHASLNSMTIPTGALACTVKEANTLHMRACRAQQEAAAKRECWRVLDSCIRTLELRNRPSAPVRPAPVPRAPVTNAASVNQAVASLVTQVRPFLGAQAKCTLTQESMEGHSKVSP